MIVCKAKQSKAKQSIAVLATNNQMSVLHMNSNQHPKTALIRFPHRRESQREHMVE